MTDYDHINPTHYQLANGVEVIDLTEQLDFLSGNAIKYIARAGKKPDQPKLQDLNKAKWYLDRLIENEIQAQLDLEDEDPLDYLPELL